MGRGKAFSTVEGGIILTDNDAIGNVLGGSVAILPEYKFFDVLKLMLYALALTVLIYPWIFWLPKSLPFLKLGESHYNPLFPIRRLSSFQAGIAKGWRTKIESLMIIRRRNIQQIADLGVTPPTVLRGILPDMIRFPVLVADADARQKVLQESERMGLGISAGYPDTIDGVVELGLAEDGNRFPMAKGIAVKIICLPVHPFVRGVDIKRIMNIVRRSLP